VLAVLNSRCRDIGRAKRRLQSKDCVERYLEAAPSFKVGSGQPIQFPIREYTFGQWMLKFRETDMFHDMGVKDETGPTKFRDIDTMEDSGNEEEKDLYGDQIPEAVLAEVKETEKYDLNEIVKFVRKEVDEDDEVFFQSYEANLRIFCPVSLMNKSILQSHFQLALSNLMLRSSLRK
jgi:hypothetical protein